MATGGNLAELHSHIELLQASTLTTNTVMGRKSNYNYADFNNTGRSCISLLISTRSSDRHCATYGALETEADHGLSSRIR